MMSTSEFSTLFELLPIGAYRSSAGGRQLRANAALVRLNGYASEAEMLQAVSDIAQQWYVDPGQRAEFLALIERDGQVINFRSEIFRHKTRERIWVEENAHIVRDVAGAVLYFEGTVEDVTQAHRAQVALEASERWFRALTEKAQVLTVLCGAEGGVSYASPASETMLGKSPESLRGSNVFDWLHPDDVADARQEQSRVLTHSNLGVESLYRYRHSDGSWRYLASLASNCLADRAVQGIVLNFRDATERKRAEQAEAALRDSEDRWKLALEGAGAGVWDCDLQTGVEIYSSRFTEMYGFEDHELSAPVGTLVARVHPDDRAERDLHWKAHFEGAVPAYVSEHRIGCRDGSWKWVLSRGMVIRRNAQGQPSRVIGTDTDITARKSDEAHLLELYRQLGEKTTLLQTTLGSISQGILMIGPDGRLSTHNARLRELLDLPESLLAQCPTLHEIRRFQRDRGDFGADARLADPHARDYLTRHDDPPIPLHYLRTTLSGRTLEIITQLLKGGGMVRTFADVTDYVTAERARKQVHKLLQATQSMAGIGGWEVDLATGQVFWTDEVYRMLETTPQEYTPTIATISRFFTSFSADKVHAAIGDTAYLGKPLEMELEMITARGRHIWVHSANMVVREHGQDSKRISVIQDITERKRTEAALRESDARWKLALDSTGDGVWDWNTQTGTQIFSRRCQEMFGYDDEEMAARSDAFDRLTHPDDMREMVKDRQAHLDGATPTYANEHRMLCKDGTWKWVLSRGMVISRAAGGAPLRMIGTLTDITSRKNSEALIWQQANFDALTGLPNRRMLRDRLEQEIKKSDRDNLQLAILFIDLDHFKEVNDTLGHDVGDRLLVEAAQRIRHCVRDADTVARMGGDEFTLVLSELQDGQRLERILEVLLAALSASFKLGDEQVYVSASIGITIYPADATEVESLFKNADQALYVAKGAGRNRFSFFTPALQEAAQNRVRLANDLRLGLAEQQFRVAYQPIVDLRTGDIRKAEALIRWQHPTRGLISPAEFIPIAESSGLIIDIGAWVFEQAAAQVKRWRAAHHPAFQISVNKSPVQFHNDAGRQQSWVEQLRVMQLAGDSLVVEITEGLLLNTSAEVTEQLLQLSDAGIQVSLDDFGTGYSSLTYLQKFDIDYIKIDQSFVRHLMPDCTELALCKAIIVMAHELGMQVIAEGVETTRQRDLLVAAGCDFAQGYLFARPMPAHEFDAFMVASVNSSPPVATDPAPAKTPA
jgi:diguanylate cyclase (GGDEF)-like protein/PAS domain S-box-containing protein